MAKTHRTTLLTPLLFASVSVAIASHFLAEQSFEGPAPLSSSSLVLQPSRLVELPAQTIVGRTFGDPSKWNRPKQPQHPLTNDAFAHAIKKWPSKRRCAVEAGPTSAPSTVRVELEITPRGNVRRVRPETADGVRERIMVACLAEAAPTLHFPPTDRPEKRKATFVF